MLKSKLKNFIKFSFVFIDFSANTQRDVYINMLRCQISPLTFMVVGPQGKENDSVVCLCKNTCILQGREEIGETRFSNGSESWTWMTVLGQLVICPFCGPWALEWITLAVCEYLHNKPSGFNSTQASLPVAIILGIQHTGQSPIQEVSGHRGTIGPILFCKPFLRLLLYLSPLLRTNLVFWVSSCNQER